MYKYSPLQNLKESSKYPATLIVTSDHDDRVVPLQSYKFTATLQEKNKGSNPIILYVNKNQGHSFGDDKSRTYIYSFIHKNLGIKEFISGD